ncbi:MAG: hypothetical protein JXQ75_05120 [Phycisphaerae bacterium]|nr:hypothetical protein [Phycisphaerae bacterium]
MPTLDYKLHTRLDDAVRDFVVSSIQRSYATNRIEIAGDRLTVGFDENVSPTAFSGLVKRLLYISRSINKDLLYENSVDHPYGEDPIVHLLESRDVIKVADGLYLYQGEFWRVFQALHDYVKRLAREYEAVEQEYPVLWPIDLFRKINYFAEFPQQAILSTSVKGSFEDKESFAQRYATGEDYESVAVTEHMADCRHGLQPAVCDLCYYTLSNETDYQNTIYTTYNKVFRNEYSTTDSLDRLLAFSVRDIMFVGDRDFVLDVRQRLIEDLIEFLRILDLNCRIETASDPFFTNDSAMKAVFQNTARLKYELLARLNHSGVYIAVGSINLHLDFFGRAFNIRLPDGTFAHSGCIGIGFERLAYALYCQYGPDLGGWPTELRKALGLA